MSQGKGSTRRPGDEAAYRDGWGRVFGKPKRAGSRRGRVESLHEARTRVWNELVERVGLPGSPTRKMWVAGLRPPPKP